MLAAQPSLELLTSPSQTPAGATPLTMPKASGAELAELIAETVTRLGIEAFWPQNAARVPLGEVPCTVHAAATPAGIALVDDKSAFMDWLGDDPYRPDQVEVLGADGVEAEYARRAAAGRVTCVKPVIGVNGHGYWKLLAEGGAEFLNDPEPREIDAGIWTAAARIAEATGGSRRMLVMDWLPGPEVSVDLLCWHGRPLIEASRIKIDANHQRIESGHTVAIHARGLAERLGLHGIVSMQYRLDDTGRWRILEINPRPAGGCIHSEDAGFGIITAWAKLLTGAMNPEDCVQVRDARTVRFARTANVID